MSYHHIAHPRGESADHMPLLDHYLVLAIQVLREQGWTRRPMLGSHRVTLVGALAGAGVPYQLYAEIERRARRSLQQINDIEITCTEDAMDLLRSVRRD